MSDKYILEGHKPVKCNDLRKWGKFMANGEIRRVAITTASVGVEVSTVFLGLDHRFSIDPPGPPILFETMVFGGPLDEEQERYCTWEEAEAGHARWVKNVKSGIVVEPEA